MYRATTPTHTFILPFDYAQMVNKCLVTYSQGGRIVLEKTQDDISATGNTITIKLTQEETKKFSAYLRCNIQIRIITSAGDSIVSEELYVSVLDVLNDVVL